MGTDTVYLYTNIQAPGSKAFWKEHGESVANLTSAASGFDVTANSERLSECRQKMPAHRDTFGEAEDEANGERSGTYDGYSGKFTCETDCNIATGADTDGALILHGRVDVHREPDC